ncbi:hypothetical protein EV356DRAFT_534892 [Viridothelium virens]|uniref:Uncharacterized protein n=1 Tax=Viridothelium virens TaxID=1048519 RepID=A0A6A6H2I8_VIRVR|nr:hypothetical protein EV356DRAFT_534892 [Viridothelium virens]
MTVGSVLSKNQIAGMGGEGARVRGCEGARVRGCAPSQRLGGPGRPGGSAMASVPAKLLGAGRAGESDERDETPTLATPGAARATANAIANANAPQPALTGEP